MEFIEGEYLVPFNDDMMNLVWEWVNKEIEKNTQPDYIYQGIKCALRVAKKEVDP